MCALTPTPLVQSFGWPLDNSTSHQNNYLFNDSFESYNSNFGPPHQQPQVQLDRSALFNTNSSGDHSVVKKLSHNASERDRRKKINTLYSSLRSLLPMADQTKKLSIPATISCVLRYIPELQQQVDGLIQKKEELLSRISTSSQGDLIHQEKRRKKPIQCSLTSILASWLTDSEVIIQISTYKHHKNPLSEILLILEEDGLLLMNASSFESSTGSAFYNLHLEGKRTDKMECEILCEKLLSLYEKKECLYPLKQRNDGQLTPGMCKMMTASL